MATVACLATRAKNTSGVSQYFGYLGKHGIRLAADAEVAIPGNLTDYVLDNDRKRTALENGLLNGDITILSGPSVILEDISGDPGSQMLSLDGGTVGAQAPCWQ